MTDFHTHILPAVDDGSKSTAESIQMLSALAAQGITAVAATPHFYANDESVENFLARRQTAYEILKKELMPDMPQILLGAEIRYYDGLSRLEGLGSLCIQGTRLLLIEMPECKWSESTLREITDIAASGRYTPVLAHIERCIFYQSEAIFGRLLANGVLMQMNADYFYGRFSKFKAIRLAKKSRIHFIGSDCHNMNSRPPVTGKAYEIIEKKLGKTYVADFIEFANNKLKINLKG